MKKVLIFGGSVFIGKAIAVMFIKKGDDVYILNRGNHPCPDGAKQIKTDRNNVKELTSVLSDQKFDLVIDGSAYLPEQTKTAAAILQKRTKHFIHISSAAVYNDDKIFPYTEQSHRGTSLYWGDYSTNKYLCEEILISLWKENNFPVTIIRPFYVYGPGNNLDRESYIFSRLLNNKYIVIPGMGIPMIQFGHIEDLCDAIFMISNNPKSIGQSYNVSGNEYVTFKGWVDICGEVLAIKPKILLVDAKSTGFKSREWFPLRDINMIGSCTKIKEELDIKPRYSILEGLKQTIMETGRESFLSSLKISDVEKNILKKNVIE